MKGATPLHILCYSSLSKDNNLTCLVEMVNMLLEANADPNVQTARAQEMWTPLHAACFKGCLEIVNSLLKAKANPNIQNIYGYTPLVLMLRADPKDTLQTVEEPPNHYGIVDALLAAKADPNIADEKNCTPLHVAVARGKADIAARLLKGKADPNILDYTNNGMAPLHIACGPDGSIETTQVILSCPNTDPNILDGNHAAPIHYAVSSTRPYILRCLIASNANPNIRNSDGFTPLHIACVLACCTPGIGVNIAIALEMTAILLKAKADPHIDSKYGTAFEIAIRHQNIVLLQILAS